MWEFTYMSTGETAVWTPSLCLFPCAQQLTVHFVAPQPLTVYVSHRKLFGASFVQRIRLRAPESGHHRRSHVHGSAQAVLLHQQQVWHPNPPCGPATGLRTGARANLWTLATRQAK